jgi:hypothetical protein
LFPNDLMHSFTRVMKCLCPLPVVLYIVASGFLVQASQLAGGANRASQIVKKHKWDGIRQASLLSFVFYF